MDIRFIRENPEIVKQNIRNKFQDSKLPLVDEVIALDAENRRTIQEANDLRAEKNRLSKQIGVLMAHGQREEAEETKTKVAESAARLAELEKLEPELEEKIRKIMLLIPNIIDPSVPIGPDDSHNVEVSASESRRCRISRFRIIRKSWKSSAAWISTAPAVSPETVFIT